MPDGAIVDIDEEGFHGVIANTWLRQHDTAYDEDDYDQSIADLVDAGGIRVATYHGTDHMNIDFAPGKVTPRALISMRKLMRETRAMFAGYFFGTTDDGPFGYAETMRRLVR